MKKLNYFLTFVAGAMMLASCSHDKDVVDPTDNNAVQQIVLQVASNGDINTRAGRDLLSEEPGQKIDNVTVVVLKVGENNTTSVHYTTTIQNWNTVSYDYTNGKQATIKLPANKKLSVSDKIRVYAYGYSNGSNYDIPTFPETGSFDEVIELNYASVTNLDTNDVSEENSVGSTTEDSETTKIKTPEEIFAGSTTEDFVVDKANFNVSVVLNRQVAGAYFYVHNIPYFKELNAKSKLRLVASDANDQLILGGFANKDIAYNGNDNGTDVKYVVNGAKSTEEPNSDTYTVICEEELGNWYSEFNKTDKGILDKAGWKSTKDATVRKGTHYVKGSVFASSFVIPFEKVSDKQTLKLELVAENGNVLRYWNVNLPSDLVPTTKITKCTKTDDVWKFSETTGTESTKIYSILRNHLYCVGSKLSDGKTPGVVPDHNNDPDPDPDDPNNPDEPEDLSKGQIIELRVNHNWEVIYHMDLEEGE